MMYTYRNKCSELYANSRICIGCLNIHGTHVTANNSNNNKGCLNINRTQVTANNFTTNNNVFFFVSDLKIVYDNNYESLITMPWTREEKYFTSLLIWRQNHSKLSQNICKPLIWKWFIIETRNSKKRLPVLEVDIITIKKNINLMSLVQRMYFLQDMFQMRDIVLVSVINHYHSNGLHLFWDILYIIIISLLSRVFAIGPGDQGSIPGWVIPKTLKMVLDAFLINTQHYKVWIKGKVDQSRESSSALPYTLV